MHGGSARRPRLRPAQGVRDRPRRHPLAEAADFAGADMTAEAVARYFARPDVEASTQLAVDRDSCVRMLPDLVIPGASGANHDGLHVEICGWASWSRARWLESGNLPMLERAAAKTARWCWLYGIPRRWLSVDELRADRRGMTTHVDVNHAFGRGDHWDLGRGSRASGSWSPCATGIAASSRTARDDRPLHRDRVRPVDGSLPCRRGARLRGRDPRRLCPTRVRPRDRTYRAEPLLDFAGLPDPDLLESLARWVDEQRGEGRTVLIHCEAGQNRSGLLTALYLIRYRGYGPEAAIALVQEKRGPNALWNGSFGTSASRRRPPDSLVVEGLQRARWAARRAGRTPAASPARKAAAASTSSVSQGTLNELPARERLRRERREPEADDDAHDRPISAVISLSTRIIRVSCARVIPIARRTPISRVRSTMESASVFTIPNRLMRTESASSRRRG